mmetsp:Transcript_5474/g.12450  ORF Transcript_5474/g.12450 Transcript_5474/m.12450 type:complete len:81 (+) Transcript_5474:69-311(+)
MLRASGSGVLTNNCDSFISSMASWYILCRDVFYSNKLLHPMFFLLTAALDLLSVLSASVFYLFVATSPLENSFSGSVPRF